MKYEISILIGKHYNRSFFHLCHLVHDALYLFISFPQPFFAGADGIAGVDGDYHFEVR